MKTALKRFIEQLRIRHVRKTMAIYVSAALTAVGILKLFMEVYDLPAQIFNVSVTILTVGAASAFLHAWLKHGPQTPVSNRAGVVLHSFFLVLALFLAYRVATTPRSTLLPANARTVAVLPFANLSGSKDDEYFSDGMTEDILTQLSKIADLRVISRTSVMQYKNTTKPLTEIARELGVGSILEGTVRRVGNRVRIVGQLINAQTDEHLWGETYDRDLSNVFEIQSEVAQQIARALKATLSPAEITLIDRKPTENLDAYAYYLRGRDLYYRFTKGDNESAIEMFKKAIQADPSYALAFAGLADAYGQRAQRFGFESDWADSAIRLSHAAIRMDPDIAEPYKSLGLAFGLKEWYRKSVEQYSAAIRINPNFSAAISNLGLMHLWTGDPESALPLIRKALELSPERIVYYFHLGSVFDALAVDSLTERYYRKTIELDAHSTFACRALSQLYVVTGRSHLAHAMLDSALHEHPDDSFLLTGAGELALFGRDLSEAERYYRAAMLELPEGTGPTTQIAYTLLKKGNLKEGRDFLQQSLAITGKALDAGSENYDHMIDRARVFSIERDTAQALEWLSKAIDSGWMLYRLLEADPQLETIRETGRFVGMVSGLKSRIVAERQRLAGQKMLY